MAHYADKYNRALKKEQTKKSTATPSPKKEPLYNAEPSFLKKDFDYRDYIISVEGYEGVMLFLYILTIPYLIGLAFIYLFIARSNFYLFLELKLSSYLIIWAIGYEVGGTIALMIILYSWFTYSSTPKEPSKKGNKREKGISKNRR